MNPIQETAEQYTLKERLRFAAKGTAIGLLIILFGKLWFFPWLHEFAASAPCRILLGIDGVHVLWYGLFVGIPVLGAIVIGATLGRRGRKILQEGQVPLRQEKVFRPTPIQRGKRATLIGYLHVLAFAPFALLALWGFSQAASLSKQVQAKPAMYAANNSLNRTGFATRLNSALGAIHASRICIDQHTLGRKSAGLAPSLISRHVHV